MCPRRCDFVSVVSTIALAVVTVVVGVPLVVVVGVPLVVAVSVVVVGVQALKLALAGELSGIGRERWLVIDVALDRS